MDPKFIQFSHRKRLLSGLGYYMNILEPPSIALKASRDVICDLKTAVDPAMYSTALLLFKPADIVELHRHSRAYL